MVIIGVCVNNHQLNIIGVINSTTCYKAFMNYCIENYFDSIIISDVLKKRFRIVQDYPDFRRAIVYDRVIGHNGLFYSTYLSTSGKIRIMKLIAEELKILLTLNIDREGN